MVVYADILIVLNLIVNYFLLLSVARFISSRVKTLRLLLSAAVGGVTSLYIFLPVLPPAAELLIKAATCFLMVLIGFGFNNLKAFLKGGALFFGITCGYAGIMMAVWHIFKPNGMVIKNSVVYFDISPLVLVVSTVCAYFAFVFLAAIFKRSAKTAKHCKVTFFADKRKAEVFAIVDTGNSIKDVFGKSEVIITDRSVAYELFEELELEKNKDLKSRYRLVPCSTVSGGDILQGFRCDRAEVVCEKQTLNLKAPILAVSKTPLKDGYTAIVNPEIFD